MRPNKIKQMWKANQCVTLGWLSVAHGFSAEVMARQGFDALCVDLQHGTAEMKDVAPMLQAISWIDKVPVARVAWNEPAAIMKALDLGAYGIIVPLGEQCRGGRAGGGCLPLSARRHALQRACARRPLRRRRLRGQCQQRDRRHGDDRDEGGPGQPRRHLRHARTSCQPSTLGQPTWSFALGLAPRGDNPDPLHMATCDKILAAAHKAGIKCVMHCAGAAFASGAVKRGFEMVMLTSDLSCMIAGARMQLDELKAKTA